MTYDLETLMDGSVDTKPSQTLPISPPNTRMDTMRDQLAQILMPADDGEDMLKKQMAQMDVLFNHALNEFATCPREATSLIQAKRLAVVMKLQQNCRQTARVLRSMRYMATLEDCAKHQISTSPAPTPARESERKEELE